LYGSDRQLSDDTFIYCAFNAHWETHTFRLPVIPAGKSWKIVAYTGDPAADDKGVYDTVTLMPRSLMLLVGQSE
jgi:glycogen operon protein